MKVIRKKPGEAPEIVEVDNTLEALQKEVGGYIQAVPFSTDCAIICNEEGKLIPLEPNLAFCGDVLFGTILVVGVDGEEFLLSGSDGGRDPAQLDGGAQDMAKLTSERVR